VRLVCYLNRNLALTFTVYWRHLNILPRSENRATKLHRSEDVL